MTPQELKNSILQLAIQGKLVEQRAEEGTGEQLYRKILAEKSNLVKAGEIKKEKPLPEIAEDEKPFDIPDGWIWVRFGNMICLHSGQDLQPSEYNEDKNGIPYITGASNFQDSVLNINRWTECARSIAHEGDLLVTCKGTVGKTAILKVNKAHIARQVMAITTFIANIQYVKYFLECQIRQLKTKAKSMIPGIERDNILSLLVPLPPLAEQKRIVAKIEILLPYIDRYEQAWRKLEDFNKRFPGDMQKSILQFAIQGKLVEQRPEEGTGEELYRQIQTEKQRLIKAGKIRIGKSHPSIPDLDFPFDLPETWKWIRLGDVLTSTDAGKSPQCENRSRQGNEWGVIKTTAVQDGYFLSNENKVLPVGFQVQASQIVHKGDFLITRAGPRNRTGIMCVVDEEPVNLILSDKTVRLTYVRGMVEPKYLCHALSSPEMQRWVIDAMTGMAASQVNISQERMWDFILPLPPLAEQKRIVAKLEEILPLCEKLKR